jgi:hypothetical protein
VHLFPGLSSPIWEWAAPGRNGMLGSHAISSFRVQKCSLILKKRSSKNQKGSSEFQRATLNERISSVYI